MKKCAWMIIAGLYALGSSVWAKDDTMWYKGQLLLRNGVELNGKLSYNWLAQVVQCQQGLTIKAYSASQIFAFTYYDSQFDTPRKFVAVECPVKAHFHRLRILEEVVTGPVLVYREYKPGHDVIKVIRSSAYAFDDASINDINLFSYLVSFNEELMDIDVFYRKIWPHLRGTFSQELKEYVKLARTNMTGITGQLRLICWYNSMTLERLFPASAEPHGLPGEMPVGR